MRQRFKQDMKQRLWALKIELAYLCVCVCVDVDVMQAASDNQWHLRPRGWDRAGSACPSGSLCLSPVQTGLYELYPASAL